ncbi:MAG: hypothetical protein Q4G27_05965 [Flavobacteriaceae bacterium]|nr:hypothetical protein [Flavobacteriaceae bacterium]
MRKLYLRREMPKLIKGHTPRKFNYIPRHYDKENNDLIFNRIGDGRFAQNYVRKKKIHNSEALLDEKRIDFSSYRVRPKRSKSSPQFSVLIILVGLMLLIAIMWLITQPEFTNIFEK